MYRTLITALALVACKTATETPTDSDPPTPVSDLTVSGAFGTYPGALPLDGATVCWHDGVAEGPCTTTDATGQYELGGVPSDTVGLVTITDDAIEPVAMPVVTGSDDLQVSGNLDTPAVSAALYTDAGVTREPNGVALTVFVAHTGPGGAVSGATVTLSPASGSGPFYYGTTTIDPAGTATSSSGAAVFLNVDASQGPFTVQVDSEESCGVDLSSGEPLQPFPVLEATTAFLRVGCEGSGS